MNLFYYVRKINIKQNNISLYYMKYYLNNYKGGLQLDNYKGGLQLDNYKGGLQPNLQWCDNRCFFDASMQLLYSDSNIRNKILNTDFNTLTDNRKIVMNRIKEIFTRMKESDDEYENDDNPNKFNGYKGYRLDMCFRKCEAPWRIMYGDDWDGRKPGGISEGVIKYIFDSINIEYNIYIIKPINAQIKEEMIKIYLENKSIKSIKFQYLRKYLKKEISQDNFNELIEKYNNDLTTKYNQAVLANNIDDKGNYRIQSRMIADDLKLHLNPIYTELLYINKFYIEFINNKFSLTENILDTNYQEYITIQSMPFQKYEKYNIENIQINTNISYQLIGLITTRQTIMGHGMALVYNEKDKKYYHYDDRKPPIRQYNTVTDFFNDPITKSENIIINICLYKLVKTDTTQPDTTQPDTTPDIKQTVLDLICNIIKS